MATSPKSHSIHYHLDESFISHLPKFSFFNLFSVLWTEMYDLG